MFRIYMVISSFLYIYITKYRLGSMPIVKNQSNLIAIFCEASILGPYKKGTL